MNKLMGAALKRIESTGGPAAALNAIAEYNP